MTSYMGGGLKKLAREDSCVILDITIVAETDIIYKKK